MSEDQKYERCMVMAGGGFRFGYYLGMHAAAEDSGMAPDIILASCGGSLAAAIIHALPDAEQRKQWLVSPAMYRFLCRMHAAPHVRPLPVLGAALLRGLSHGRAKRVPDVFDDYMFELPGELPLPASAQSHTALAIVAAKLLFRREHTGQMRGERPLFAEVVLGPDRACGLLEGWQAPASSPAWSCGAVAPGLLLDSTMPIADAVRSSITDMLYFACHAHGGEHYMGGVIDLFPIEIAHGLARHVTMEAKPPFGQVLAIPALRQVLGIDGNARLKHVHAQHAHAWVDTSDISRALRGSGMRKRIDWLGNRIRLEMPHSLAAYAQDVEAQWQYGYQRGIEAYARPGLRLRHETRFNRGSK
ncbi:MULTISPECIES: patatin-like phospholipase family protein [unclassified Duganella]|uniref:patatin-like phospholipase family protein n=1 Tax=unclassified Duganella TaxID=2636909 RepID=UPI0009E9C152|nr:MULTISPECIES: patatin-like phospholipase family protein [unclassified Duganella]